MTPKEHNCVMVLKEFLTEKLGRKVDFDEALVCMEALERGYNEGQFKVEGNKMVILK